MAEERSESRGGFAFEREQGVGDGGDDDEE
jgi:hypothetical protein